jgi:hypothetical protein
MQHRSLVEVPVKLRERPQPRRGPSLRSEFVTFSNAPKFGVASNVVTVTKIGKNQKSHNLSG